MNADRSEELSYAIDIVNSVVNSAREGLPESLFLFISKMTPLINVDLLVKNHKSETLLSFRHDAYYGPGWHIPGGIVRFKERLDQRISIVAKTELGASVQYDAQCIRVTEMFHETRDVRGHFISHLYRCELASEISTSRLADPRNPKHGQLAWFSVSPPNLIPQHRCFADLINN